MQIKEMLAKIIEEELERAKKLHPDDDLDTALENNQFFITRMMAGRLPLPNNGKLNNETYLFLTTLGDSDSDKKPRDDQNKKEIFEQIFSDKSVRRVLGSYKIESVLGCGNFGIVFNLAEPHTEYVLKIQANPFADYQAHHNALEKIFVRQQKGEFKKNEPNILDFSRAVIKTDFNGIQNNNIIFAACVLSKANTGMIAGRTGASMDVKDLNQDPIRDVTRTMHGFLEEFFTLSKYYEQYKAEQDPQDKADLERNIEDMHTYLADSIFLAGDEPFRGKIDISFNSAEPFSEIVLKFINKAAETKNYISFANHIYNDWYLNAQYKGSYKRIKMLSREQFVKIIKQFFDTAEGFYDSDKETMKRFDFHFGNVGFRNRSDNMIVFDP